MFFEGFEKQAKAKWQKMWNTVSDASKQRLQQYAGAGTKDLKGMREGMFMPRVSATEAARRNKLDHAIYNNALHQLDVKVRNSLATPYALKETGERGHMVLPKNPSAGNKTRALSRPDISGAEGTHNRGMLAHEDTELMVERLKGKRNAAGKEMRTHKAIQENADVVHSSAHPLIAEANTAGRNPKTLHDMRTGWAETPAQGQMYASLKRNGWTPASGMPVYGRQANAVQRDAEKTFAPHFKTMLGSQVRRARGNAAKRQLIADSREFAGGGKLAP